MALRLASTTGVRALRLGARSLSSSMRVAQTPEPPKPTHSDLPTLDFSPTDQAERTGARSAKDSLSTIERRRRRMLRIGVGLMVLGAGAGWVYMGREWEEGENKGKTAEMASNRFTRANARISDLFKWFTEPAWPELLPAPLPEKYQKPYTLLISIDDLLVTSTWDRKHGWRTAKRPGVDYFLAYISQFYEVVIFTTQSHYTAIPIIDKLDPYQYYIAYHLFRDATRSIRGTVVKDLSYLNRDLSKVIAIDTESDHYSLHPENAIILPKWKGEAGDQGLVRLIPFLESVAMYSPQDVRPVLKQFEGKDIAIEYAKQEAEGKHKHIAEWQAKRKAAKGLGTGSVTLSGLFSGSSTPSTPDQPPPTFLEQRRMMAQQIYREEQEFFRTNADKLKKAKEDQQAQQMKEFQQQSGGSLIGMFVGGAQAPPKPDGEANPKPT